MNGVLEERGTTRVGVDHSSLTGVVAGTDIRYSVKLLGPAEGAWAEAYRILQGDSTAFRRLRLDAATRTVCFTCRAIDGPTQVFDALDRLDTLIKMVNQQVASRR